VPRITETGPTTAPPHASAASVAPRAGHMKTVAPVATAALHRAQAGGTDPAGRPIYSARMATGQCIIDARK
jgi:hypothetical protein